MWDAVVWQHPFLTSGYMSSISGTQYTRTLLTTLVHVLQLSALYQKYVSPLLHTWYGQPYWICPCTCKILIILENNFH